LTPISNIPTSVVKTQQILFASLAITLVVAFVAVLGKQWILYYTRVTSWGNIVDRGKERQAKLVGLQKWGLHLIMESLPVMLQFALLLFGVALAVYLWDLSVSVAKVVLGVTSVGFVFYVCIVISATIWSDCPFQTPLSVLLPKIRPFAKELIVLIRARFERWSRKAATLFLLRIERMTEHGRLTNFLKKVLRTFTGMTDVTNHAGEAAFEKHYTMALSNPAFWRQDPLFDSPISKDIAASAGFWLLENSTDFSAASAVAAVFPEFQWPSHRRSTTALVRLHDTYAECFRVPESNKSTRLKALQSAAAYYVLYHTQLIWSTSNNLEIEVGKLPSDLFVHKPREEWDRDDVFEYLLHVKLEERSEPVTSARFLSYIAPYWFCGDSDATVRFRPRRLDRLPELIGVLEESRALNPTTVTECVLCVGAVMDFPLHPEDLNRVDKRYVLSPPHMSAVCFTGDSDYFQSAFKLVVEHIHGIVLARGRRSRHTTTALEVLLTLVKKTTLALVEATWINGLLKKAVGGDMDDETFTLLLRLSALRKERDAAADVETPPGQDYAVVQGAGTYPPPPGEIVSPENLTPEHALFSKILKNVETCIGQEGGWQDEAVYGGLVAITDIPRLESCLPEVGFLRTLSKAMEKEGNKPFRVRKAAFDVILVVRDGWLRSVDLRQAFRDSDIPRQLHGVVHETARPDHQVALLEMMEALSNDRYWHPYLRGAMDIWLPFRHEGPDHILCILSKIGGLPLLEYDGSNPPLDEFLEKLVEDEWSGIPGRHVQDLTADRLRPLAEVTERFKELLFAESDRRAVLAVVEQVIPSLERQDGGPGEDVRRTIDDLLKKLRSQSTRRRSNTYWR